MKNLQYEQIKAINAMNSPDFVSPGSSIKQTMQSVFGKQHVHAGPPHYGVDLTTAVFP